MANLSCRRIQTEAGAVLASVDHLHKIVTILRDAVPIDLEAVSEDEMSWCTKPSPELFLYGALAAGLEGLEDAVEGLERASRASPALIEERWRQLCESRSRAADQEDGEEAFKAENKPLRADSRKST